jgi:hypothetical protein
VIDIQKLIGEVAARNGVRVDHDDPIFAVTTINRLMLDDATENLIQRVRAAIKEFEASARAVESHAGKLLAEEVRKTASAWKAELGQEINLASLRSAELVNKVHLAHTRPNMVRWGASGLIVGLILFGCGVWLGSYIR